LIGEMIRHFPLAHLNAFWPRPIVLRQREQMDEECGRASFVGGEISHQSIHNAIIKRQCPPPFSC
jgi:hypothetical protein